jgi:serine phosphatase RsbU (regulator of sigma subunit)
MGLDSIIASMPDPTDSDEAGTRTVIGSVGRARPPAEDDRAHYLVVVEGGQPGMRIELGPGKLVIGRQEPADIVIPDTQISRRHCRVGMVMGELFVTDLESSNGTYVAGAKITGSKLVAPGERITLGNTVLEHEWRSRRDVEAARALDTDLDNAKQYVRSLLPVPLQHGRVRTDWVLQPSAKLGGDMFGYHFVDEHRFAICLLDVSGHGINAAMHAVSVMNVLRQRDGRTGVDPRDPAAMAAHLNAVFQMDSHGGMLLSLWYGVFDLESRTVAFTSAGHHAAYLVGAGREGVQALDVSNVLIGMMPAYAYKAGRADFAPGSSLYLFSDGVFEIEASDGRKWGLGDFLPLLTAPAVPGKAESQRILEGVKALTGRQAFEDDFTLVVAAFG